MCNNIYPKYKAFRRVEIVFVQGRNLVPSRLAIGWWKVNKPRQPIAGLFVQAFYLGLMKFLRVERPYGLRHMKAACMRNEQGN